MSDLKFLTPLSRVFATLAANPGWSQREVADALGLSESRVSRLILSLAKANLVVRTKYRTSNFYEIAPNYVTAVTAISTLLALEEQSNGKYATCSSYETSQSQDNEDSSRQVQPSAP